MTPPDSEVIKKDESANASTISWGMSERFSDRESMTLVLDRHAIFGSPTADEIAALQCRRRPER